MLTEFIIIMFSFANSLSLWPKSQPFDGLTVAPHVGAWIEIPYDTAHSCGKVGRTPRGCVDWNIKKNESRYISRGRTPRGCVDWNSYHSPVMPIAQVAPHVGAWIEITSRTLRESKAKSHPTWVRGLKFVETVKRPALLSRTPRGCVDWNNFAF